MIMFRAVRLTLVVTRFLFLCFAWAVRTVRACSLSERRTQSCVWCMCS